MQMQMAERTHFPFGLCAFCLLALIDLAQLKRKVAKTRQRPSPLTKVSALFEAPLALWLLSFSRDAISLGCTQSDREISVGTKHDDRVLGLGDRNTRSQGISACAIQTGSSRAVACRVEKCYLIARRSWTRREHLSLDSQDDRGNLRH